MKTSPSKLGGLRSFFRSWFLASRPFSLQASTSPVLIGTAAAGNVTSIHWPLFGLAIIGAVLIQIQANLVDELSDHKKNASKDKYPAPYKVLQRGLISEQAMLIGISIIAAVIVSIGIVIVILTNLLVLLVGIISLSVAILYSGGPFPLGKLGLGELLVFVFMGPIIVASSYYIQTGTVTWQILAISLPSAFLVTAILHCNNMRDIDEDQLEKKRSLAGTLGIKHSRLAYAYLVILSSLCLTLLVILDTLPIWSLLGLLSLRWSAIAIRRLKNQYDRNALNRIMIETSKANNFMGSSMAITIAIQSTV